MARVFTTSTPCLEKSWVFCKLKEFAFIFVKGAVDIFGDGVVAKSYFCKSINFCII